MRVRIFAAYLMAIVLLLALNPMPPPTAAAWQAQAATNWEEKFRLWPQAERLKEYLRVLSAEPHHLGSAADRRNAEWMRDQLKSWGLDVRIEEFDVLFPTPKERVLTLISPHQYQAKLKEPVLAEDPDSNDENQVPTYNAYSGDGDVTAQLVYVNYGVRRIMSNWPRWVWRCGARSSSPAISDGRFGLFSSANSSHEGRTVINLSYVFTERCVLPDAPPFSSRLSV